MNRDQLITWLPFNIFKPSGTFLWLVLTQIDGRGMSGRDMGQIPRINDPGIDNAVQREPVQKPQNVTKVNGPTLTPPPPTISHGQLTGRRMVPQLTRGGPSLGSSGHISCLVGFGACYAMIHYFKYLMSFCRDPHSLFLCLQKCIFLFLFSSSINYLMKNHFHLTSII